MANASKHGYQSDLRAADRGYFDKPYGKSKTYGQPAKTLRQPVDRATGPVHIPVRDRRLKDRSETAKIVEANIAKNERHEIVRGTFVGA